MSKCNIVGNLMLVKVHHVDSFEPVSSERYTLVPPVLVVVHHVDTHCLRMCYTKGSSVFDKMLPVDDNV